MANQLSIPDDPAWGEFTKTVAKLAARVNEARQGIENLNLNDGSTIYQSADPLHDARCVRDYENAMEQLKEFIQNKTNQSHNGNLMIETSTGLCAIRALEVELVHPIVNSEGKCYQVVGPINGIPCGEEIPSRQPHEIIAVQVRGFISNSPDGNLALNFSSRSSSSSVPPPP